MLKFHKLYFQGLRGDVIHYYFETYCGHVIFAAGSEMFYQFNCVLSNRRKLRERHKKCQRHEIKDLDNSKLEAMIDRWCSTDDRWEADALKKKLRSPVMYIVQEKEKRNIESKVWKELHRFGKNLALGPQCFEKAMAHAKKKLGEVEFAELKQRTAHMLAQYQKNEEAAQ